NNSFWDFGDGNIIMGAADPVHTFAAPGNYVVKYAIGVGACSDTVRKTISINITHDNLILTPDTTICFGSVKQLRTVSSLDFCWSPVTYLDNPDSPNPVTSATQDIVYYFTAEVTGTNLIINGDFSQGNTGFTSGYSFAGSNTTEGQYFVGSNPQTWNNSLSNCKDHSTGNGNMMLINGSPAPDVNIWKQTVNVTPNTNYAFSTWIQALYTPNPAELQFSINGKDAGSLITASLPTCTWTQFYTTWNSGDNTTAVISIVNKNTEIQGNDFALDDISFAPVFIKRDSVKISVEKPFVQSNKDTIVCAGSSVQLNTNGTQNYIWSPAAGLSNTGIPNPVASPVTSTEYIVTGTTINGCSAKDTVNVNVYTKPAMSVSNDTIICSNSSAQLLVTGGAAYVWSPSATLNSPNVYNPVATPAVDTRYYVTITDNNNCEYMDSTDVTIRAKPVFSISSPKQVCLEDSTQLMASGGDVYTWQPARGLDNAGIANPLASPSITTDYSVTITETVCNESEMLSTRLTVMPLPFVSAVKSNDIDCSNDRSQLNATGADQYVWTPAETLNNPNILNPLATPVATTEYIVKGTNLTGCKGYDTIVVKVDNVNKGGYEMPNAFTPNNDGLNDCYGIKYWGIINDLEFSIYNRWGERIFFTKTPGRCWDGTYKGVKQDVGVYVYMIKAKTTCETEVFRKGTFVLIR
ncbi:MAG TPA: gliding motility-associated C-terminal domain-containing protein, partial [Chitinophagaceae bacterium]|nr:gliding motility-associated C-terminal domain-containing protein [Chitinophagaceae bacterium]